MPADSLYDVIDSSRRNERIRPPLPPVAIRRPLTVRGSPSTCPSAHSRSPRCRFRPDQSPSPEVHGARAKLLLDAQEPVVLGNPLRAGRGTSLDLADPHGHHEVRDRGVLSLTGPMAHEGRPTTPPSHVDGRDRLGQGADLIELD